MADTLTTHFSWVMPADQASNDTWGAKLNADLQAIDSQVWSLLQVWTPVTSYNPLTTHSNLCLQTDASNRATVSFFNSLAGAGKQLRWQLSDDNAPETGGNAGSNFSLRAYDDNGVALGTPIAVNRASGSVALGTAGSTITFNGAASFTQSLSSTAAFTCGSPLTLLPDSVGSYAGAAASINFPNTFVPTPPLGGKASHYITWGNIVASGTALTIYGPQDINAGTVQPIVDPRLGNGAYIQIPFDTVGEQSWIVMNGETNFISPYPTISMIAGKITWLPTSTREPERPDAIWCDLYRFIG